jgi:hypothetical protein
MQEFELIAISFSITVQYYLLYWNAVNLNTVAFGNYSMKGQIDHTGWLEK